MLKRKSSKMFHLNWHLHGFFVKYLKDFTCFRVLEDIKDTQMAKHLTKAFLTINNLWQSTVFYLLNKFKYFMICSTSFQLFFQFQLTDWKLSFLNELLGAIDFAAISNLDPWKVFYICHFLAFSLVLAPAVKK